MCLLHPAPPARQAASIGGPWLPAPFPAWAGAGRGPVCSLAPHRSAEPQPPFLQGLHEARARAWRLSWAAVSIIPALFLLGISI